MPLYGTVFGAAVELPQPTGPFAVGRRAVDWVDASRADPWAGGPRRLPVTIWYPAERGEGRAAPYLPKGFLPHAVMFGIAAAGRIRTHSVEGAAVAGAGGRRFPVLLFSPSGWAPYFFGATLEELASHGYVVVGLQHPSEMVPATVSSTGRWTRFRSAAVAGALTPSKGPHAEDVRERGAVVDVKAADLLSVLDRLAAPGGGALAGRLDLERVGAFGHSFGGAAAIVAAQRDRRVLAAANIDGGLWRAPEDCRLDRPSLLITAEHPEMCMPCERAVSEKFYPSVEYCREDRELVQACWGSQVASGTPGLCVQVRGAEHRSFMDFKLLRLRRWSIGAMGHGSIDGLRLWQVLTRSLRALFDPHVAGRDDGETLEGIAAELPELLVTDTDEVFDPIP